jgi:hypothetical protein
VESQSGHRGSLTSGVDEVGGMSSADLVETSVPRSRDLGLPNGGLVDAVSHNQGLTGFTGVHFFLASLLPRWDALPVQSRESQAKEISYSNGMTTRYVQMAGLTPTASHVESADS